MLSYYAQFKSIHILLVSLSGLLFLVAYILLGALALKRAPTESVRRISYVAALGLFIFMVSVALNHHPLDGFGKDPL